MTTPQTTPELLACPFCSRPAPADLSDTLYPNGVYWREDAEGRYYISHYNEEDRQEDDQRCWEMHCTVNMGGCGASISADSREEVIAKWNTRPTTENSPDGKTGWPPGMLQDDDRGLSRWLASKPNARQEAREAAQSIVEPRFQHTFCQSCGKDCGPGDDGPIDCGGHAHLSGKGAPQPLAVPPGYALVPLEPTAEMLNANGVDSGEKTARKTYIAMVAAAPQPPASALPDTGNVGADGWCQYLAGMIETYLKTNPPQEGRDAAIAGIIQRRLRWLPSFSELANLRPPGRGMVPKGGEE